MKKVYLPLVAMSALFMTGCVETYDSPASVSQEIKSAVNNLTDTTYQVLGGDKTGKGYDAFIIKSAVSDNSWGNLELIPNERAPKYLKTNYAIDKCYTITKNSMRCSLIDNHYRNLLFSMVKYDSDNTLTENSIIAPAKFPVKAGQVSLVINDGITTHTIIAE